SAAIAEFGVRAGLLHVAAVGVGDMTAGTTGIAVVARIVVRPEEPHVRVVEPSLKDVEDWDRDAQPGRRAAIRLFQIRPSGLIEELDFTGRVRVADLGELRLDRA